MASWLSVLALRRLKFSRPSPLSLSKRSKRKIPIRPLQQESDSFAMTRCGRPTRNGDPCRSFLVPGRSHCQWHGPKCQGKKREGQNWNSRAIAELDWRYCHKDHDPQCPSSSPTALFRLENLRDLKGSAVREYRDGRDAYTSNPLSSLTKKELDHVMKLHVVRDSYDAVTLHGTNFRARKKALLVDLQDIANDTKNLNFTTPKINQIKFEAVYAFQETYKTGDVRQEGQGLFAYLESAKSKHYDGRLTREESGAISREMRAASDALIDGLQDENPLQAKVIDILHDNFVAMKLK